MDDQEEKVRKEYSLNDLNLGKDINGEKIEQKADFDTLNFDNPEFSFVPKGTHNWRQRGYYIHCDSCDLGHGVFIGAEKVLVGINEIGHPILTKKHIYN